MEHYVIVPLIAFVAGGLGSFLGAYLKKKGENLATREDIDGLVEQVRAVTQAAKEIEAKISDQVWDRQRLWEMKRDALFSAAKTLGTTIDAFISFYTACETASKLENPADHLPRKLEKSKNWSAAMAQFDEAATIALIVFGKELGQALNQARLLLRDAASQAYSGDIPAAAASIKTISLEHVKVLALIRKELNIQSG